MSKHSFPFDSVISAGKVRIYLVFIAVFSSTTVGIQCDNNNRISKLLHDAGKVNRTAFILL